MKKPEQIITNRLVLKSLTDSDRDDMVSILHSEVKKTYMIPDLHNKEEEDKLFNRLKQVTEDSNHFAFGIFLDNEVIGYLNDVEKNDEEIEIGYFVSPNKWGHGYASEAFKAAKSFCADSPKCPSKATTSFVNSGNFFKSASQSSSQA